MSNFEFIRAKWPTLYRKLRRAESRARTEPISSASYSRLTLEHCMHLIYDLENIELPEDFDLFELMRTKEIKALIHPDHLVGLHIVRKIGNSAAHYGRNVSSDHAIMSLRYLFSFLKWFAYMYNNNCPELPPVFDKNRVPFKSPQNKIQSLKEEHKEESSRLLEEIEELKKEKEKAQEKANSNACKLKAYKEEVKSHQTKLSSIHKEYSEKETQIHLMDFDVEN